ncbi:MAG: hypothetical protein WDW38_002356 [Sanguina aurantia]
MNPCHLLGLDDACLLAVIRFLNPLPDLFALSQTCSRFKLLMTDRAGRALSVNPNACSQPGTSLAGNIFRTLSAAVHASQPGDTIHLVAGVQHNVQNVVIPWPLHLKGSGGGCSWSQGRAGAKPGERVADTTLLGRHSPHSTAVSHTVRLAPHRASCKVTNLSIRSTLAPCIVHCGGVLHVEGCHLTVDPGGLAFLCSPLVTCAATAPPLPLLDPPRSMSETSEAAACASAAATASGRVSHQAQVPARNALSSMQVRPLPRPSAARRLSAARRRSGSWHTRAGLNSSGLCPHAYTSLPSHLLHSLQGPALTISAHLPALQASTSGRTSPPAAAVPPLPSSPTASTRPSPASPVSHPSFGQDRCGDCSAAALNDCAVLPVHATPAGPGRLRVVESRLEGGASAVACRGTGVLQSVRVIYRNKSTLFWLDVDSCSPGPQSPSHLTAAALASSCPALRHQQRSTLDEMDCDSLPSPGGDGQDVCDCPGGSTHAVGGRGFDVHSPSRAGVHSPSGARDEAVGSKRRRDHSSVSSSLAIMRRQAAASLAAASHSSSTHRPSQHNTAHHVTQQQQQQQQQHRHNSHRQTPHPRHTTAHPSSMYSSLGSQPRTADVQGTAYEPLHHSITQQRDGPSTAQQQQQQHQQQHQQQQQGTLRISALLGHLPASAVNSFMQVASATASSRHTTLVQQ